jgi:hypothetical protein
MKEFEILVYDEDESIVSSSHFEEEPTEQMLDELLSDGIRLECYEVEGDDYSKLLFTMDNEEYSK